MFESSDREVKSEAVKLSPEELKSALELANKKRAKIAELLDGFDGQRAAITAELNPEKRQALIQNLSEATAPLLIERNKIDAEIARLEAEPGGIQTMEDDGGFGDAVGAHGQAAVIRRMEQERDNRA